jgi:uncharacterized membrane protein YdbT with pleckstrin-like domain
MCCVAVACYLSVIAVMAAMPRVILLADLNSPPGFTRVVSIISVILPIILAILAAWWVYRTSRIIRDPNGGIRVVHAAAVGADCPPKDPVSEPKDAGERG